MNYNEILFDTLKKHEWDKFIKLIRDDAVIDVNIRDEQNNTLITYAVLYNRKDVVEELIIKGAYIDVIDAAGKSILYQTIHFSYIDLLQLLLLSDSKTLGTALIDIQDKDGYIPLHYAIIKKSTYAIKLLLDYGSNVNILDNEGNSSLHLAVYTKKLEIYNIIMQKNPNINHKTNTGESALHIAINISSIDIANALITDGIDINIQDNEYELTVLDYAITMGAKGLCIRLIDLCINLNSQDYYGNTALHYALREDMDDIVQRLIKSKTININLSNVEGHIPLHIVLLFTYKKIYVDLLLSKSNLNIQDNYGNTCLHLLIKQNLWGNFVKNLENKKLDIVVKNNGNKMPFDYINESDKSKFLDIVATSYLHRLKSFPMLWVDQWENDCSQSKLLNNTKCISTIKDKINLIITQKDYSQTNKTYPVKYKLPIKIQEGCVVELCTFIGTTLDILIGIIYLIDKHNNVTSLLNSDFVENKGLYKFYKSIGINRTTKFEFLNFELIWVFEKLYTPTYFYEVMEAALQNKKRFIIMPLGIELRKGNHSNYIIYDKKTNILERFEPHGSRHPLGLNYNSKVLDAVIKSKFSDIIPNLTYLSPYDYLPKTGFQVIDSFETHIKKLGDPSGFCSLWSIWYVDMKLTYPNISSSKLVKRMIKYLKQHNISFKNMIRNYSLNLTKIRDNILNKNNLDINLWLNEQYTTTQYNNIILDLKTEINKQINK